MQPVSYARHQFQPAIIRHAVSLYLRFTLSYRDVEELLAERGLDISLRDHPALGAQVRACVRRNLRRLRPRSSAPPCRPIILILVTPRCHGSCLGEHRLAMNAR
jgi:putative transposase